MPFFAHHSSGIYNWMKPSRQDARNALESFYVQQDEEEEASVWVLLRLVVGLDVSSGMVHGLYMYTCFVFFVVGCSKLSCLIFACHSKGVRQ